MCLILFKIRKPYDQSRNGCEGYGEVTGAICSNAYQTLRVELSKTICNRS